MTDAPRERVWFDVFLGGQLWMVLLVSPNHPRLVDDDCCYGRTYDDLAKIYINDTYADPVVHDTLVHELLHAVIRVTDAHRAMGSNDRREESVVRAMTPVFHRLLVDMGFNFPKVPR